MKIIKSIFQKFYQLRREDPGMLIFAALIGLSTGLLTVVLIYALSFLSHLAFGVDEPGINISPQFPWYYILTIPAIGGLIVWFLTNKVFSEAKGHGVPDVIESVLRKGGMIKPSTIWGKSLASMVTISSGGSAGMEGPIVQIGGAIGSTIGQIFRVDSKQLQTLVAAGTAAGIGAVFNAPMAGAIFAAEVIIGNFSIRNFSPIIIASVVGTSVTHSVFGNYPAFSVPEFHLTSFWEYGFYIILGTLTGMASALFMKSFFKIEHGFSKLKIPSFLKPALGGLMVGAIGIYLPHILGPGYDTIQLILDGNMILIMMLVLIGVKILATGFSLGSGGSGGIFAPSFFIGAAVGGAVGYMAHWLFPDITSNYSTYALVGMGGFLAGLIRAPLASILMIFEITGDYTSILPLMFTCMISALVSRSFQKESFFTGPLLEKGIQLFKGRDVNILKPIPVSDIMSKPGEVILIKDKLNVVISKMMNSRSTLFFVTDDDNRLKGMIDFNDIKNLIATLEDMDDMILAADIVKTVPFRIRKSDSVGEIVRRIPGHQMEALPVVGKNEVLVGVLLWNQIIETYNNEVNKMNLVDHLFENFNEVNDRKEIDMLGNNKLIETQVPPAFIGKSIKQLDLRRKYGMMILAVKISFHEDDKQDISDFSPDPDYLFEGNEHIVFLVPENRVKKLPV